MAAVHEDVEERAREEQQVRQYAEHVRGVFRDEVEASNGEKGQQDQPTSGSQETAALLGLVPHSHRYSIRGASRFRMPVIGS